MNDNQGLPPSGAADVLRELLRDTGVLAPRRRPSRHTTYTSPHGPASRQRKNARRVVQASQRRNRLHKRTRRSRLGVRHQ